MFMRLTLQNSVIISLFACEIGVLCMLVSSQTWIAEPFYFQSRRWEYIFWFGVAILVAGTLLIYYAWLKKVSIREDIVLPTLMNLVVVVLLFGVAELSLRILSKPDPLGVRIGQTILLPFDWNKFSSFNLKLYENSLQENAFYVGHSNLGWAIGAGRKSEDGLYVSSKRGLRSRLQGEDLLLQKTNHRIALFGNSFMFSEEVDYDSSLQNHMQEQVKNLDQVISFGVPGYGIDQAVLRYEEELNEWNPDTVILAFIRDDIYRALNVYTGLKPTWGIPFSKPRYLERDGEWSLYNVPNLSPVEIYNKKEITALPLLEHDAAYFAYEWEDTFLDWSILFRYLISIYPPWSELSPTTDNKALVNISGFMANKFKNLAEQNNDSFLVVYLPSRSDFIIGNELKDKQNILSAMNKQGVSVYDATDCLIENVELSSLFVDGGVHYSSAGNKALANCLLHQLDI